MTTDSKHLFLKLIEACKRKDLKTIQGILEERPKLLYCQDRYHRTVFHYVVVLILDSNISSEGDHRAAAAAGDANPLDENGQVPLAGGREQQLQQQQQHLLSLRCLKCFRFLLDKCDQQSQRLEAGHPQRLAKLWCQADLDGLTILHLAVISCNTLLVREILSCSQPLPTIDNNLNPLQQLQQLQPLLVNCLDKEHHSPLHWAVITNNLTCVKLLIDRGGVQLVHQADLNGATPLHYATQTNDYPKYRQQLRQMLKNVTRSGSKTADESNEDHQRTEPPTSSETISRNQSGRPQVPTSGNKTTAARSTSLVRGQWVSADHHSCQSESNSCATGSDTSGTQLDVLGYLIRLPGVDLECRDRDARTPLLWAASSGNRQAISLLISAGANPLCQDANRLGALHCAASHGFIECLECLLSLAPLIARQHQIELHQQINQPDNLNCTPLFYAVLSGNIDCVELLLDRGAQHDWQDVKGRTAAHFAALKGQLSTLKLLEARGCNLWLANKQGDLPLHYAIKSGRQQVVAWLLEHSPYERAVNAINNAGRAPIHLAIMKNNPAMVEFLIRRGANLNQLVKVRDKAAVMAAIKRSGSSGSALGHDESIGPMAHQNGAAPAQSRGYRYETALDMAHRLNQSGDASCLELLTGAGAQFAANVLSSRRGQTVSGNGLAGPVAAGNVRSLFDLQAVDLASPIGFDTSASSAEPQSDKLPQAAANQALQSVPKLPARPAPLRASLAHQSDSTGSSALSQSSLTSVRGLSGVGGEGVGAEYHNTTGQQQQRHSFRNDKNSERHQQQQQQQQRWTPVNEEQRAGGSQSAARNRTGPYRGGINYQNEHISASIKCKLYGNTVNQTNASSSSSHSPHHQGRSFPPLTETAGGGGPKKYHSAGPERARSRQQQEIITHVNVFTSPVHHCSACNGQCGHFVQSMAADTLCLCEQCQIHTVGGQRVKRGPQKERARVSASSGSKAEASHARHYAADMSSTTDSDDVTSDTIYDGDSDEVQGGTGRHYLPDLGENEANATAGRRSSGDLQQQQQPLRYVPPSQAYTQHLPVILSAEEERSTSGETTTINSGGQAGGRGEVGGKQAFGTPTGDDIQLTPVSPLYEQGTLGNGRLTDTGAAAPVPLLTSTAQDELRFDRSQRGGGHGSSLARRYRDQVTSPVAEYIHQRPVDHRHLPAGNRASDVRNWQHQQQKLDYSQVKAKVDSHRNDSGLSSHFGDDLDYFSGRRSKSWSTLSSSGGGVGGLRANHQPQQSSSPAVNKQHHHHHHQHPHSKSPLHHHHHHHHQHQQQAVGGAKAVQHCGSVDSVELASSVGKTIRKYKQETKLFEELQNLKRSQIRSGRANEALLVKRLVERFRHDAQQADALIGLEVYRGPYTYKAYELYLYDQLRKLSQSNRDKLIADAGLREPQKSTTTADADGDTVADASMTAAAATSQSDSYARDQRQKGRQSVGDVDDEDSEERNGRDYLEEDLRAEYELQRVINRSEHDDLVQRSHLMKDALDDFVTPSDRIVDSEEPDVSNNSEQQQHQQHISESDRLTKQVEREIIKHESTRGDSIDGDGQSMASSEGRSMMRADEGSERSEVGLKKKAEYGLDDDRRDKEAPKDESDSSEKGTTVRQLNLHQQPEAAAATGSGQNISSASSSRRSSVDIEREKLDKLPLRVAASDQVQEVEAKLREAAQEEVDDLDPANRLDSSSQVGVKKLLETQASELSSAIITDALGNISRAGSRAGSRPDSPAKGQLEEETKTAGLVSASHESADDQIEAEEQEGASDKASESDIKEDEKLAASEAEDQSLESDAEERDAVKATRAYGSRRKSVVNIGNKMEVIYHNVGIEIGPLVDGDRSSEDGDQGGEGRGRDDQPVDQAAGDADDVTYELRGGRLDRLEEDTRQEQDGEEHDEVDREDEGEGATEKQASLEDDTTSKDASLISNAEEDYGASAIQRRASSPESKRMLAGLRRTGGEDRGSQIASTSRHSSISGTRDSSVGGGSKKVFNGFDLDENLHLRRAKRLSRNQSVSDQEAANKAGEDKAVTAKPYKRRQYRLRRSRLPKGAYKVVIPIGAIRERWNAIKQQERLKLREISSRELEQSFISPQPASGANLRDVQSSKTRMSHTKSQPNLEDRARQVSELLSDETLDDCCSNYTLIYEINKSIGLRNQQLREQQQRGQMIAASNHRELKWCQRKVTKIVDVRTLKRTLSLPESYLYSNDLLKRFNILKL